MAELPALPVIISTGLIDSINPCAIGVLILLIATLLALSKDKKKMLVIGLIYIAAVYVTYFAAGIGLLLFIQKFSLAEPISIFVGGLVIILGLIEIKDFWWYGQGISLTIPASQLKRIKRYAKKASIGSSIILGIFVAAVELPCTGGPYLAITTILSQGGLTKTAVAYLLLYNFIFVLPLILILLLVYFGFNVNKVKAWKQSKRKWMRLFMGIVMVALGVLLILFARGAITFGLVY